MGKEFVQPAGDEQLFECRAAALEAALDGADWHLQDVCDFVVGEAFHLAQDDDGAEGFGQLAEAGLDADPDLGLRGVVVGRAAAVGEGGAEAKGFVAVVAFVRAQRRVDGELLALVPAPPAALVAGFVERDAVKPGAQAGLAMEAADAAEDFDEDFLGYVRGVGRVLQAARDEGKERLRILGDEQAERLLRSRP